jgi:general secretion pathway protein B
LMSVFPSRSVKPVVVTGQHEQLTPSVDMAPAVSTPSAGGNRVLTRKEDRSAHVALQPVLAGKERVYGKPSASDDNPKSLNAGEARQKISPARISPSQEKSPEPGGSAGQLSKPSLAPTMPVLILTGIAWQKDSVDRVAVVNGISVTEGMLVGGARVEEIFQDRVRFSFDKRAFDVVLGRSSLGK